MTTQASTSAARDQGSSAWRSGLIALALALVANHVIRLIAVALLNPDPGFTALTSWVPVTLFTVLPVLIATGVYAVTFAVRPPRRGFRQGVPGTSPA